MDDVAVQRPARNRPAPIVTRRGDETPTSASTSTPARNKDASSSSSSNALNIYKDAAVEELCNLKTFQEDYNTRDFLAGLSDRLIARSRADPGPFNPRPFIRTFESAIEQLQGVRNQLSEEQTHLSSSVQVAQSAYSSKLHELSSQFTSVSQSFSSLESRFGEVSRTAITIGEQLEIIDRQRQRAVEAHDLIEHYYAFARGDTSKLDRLRKEGGRQGRLRTAIIARRLGAISREVDVAGAEEIRETVDRYNERFERDMLKLFDKFYRKSDPRMMSHIAQVLQNFNGGQSCVQIYVNQHDFFISKDRVGEASRIENSPIWSTMSDPDALPPQSEPHLAALFDEIRDTVEQEAQIISAVFPDPLLVMTTFLQRVFAQSVQGFIENLLAKASDLGASSTNKLAAVEGQGGSTARPAHSDLAFLRVLQMARAMSLSLINDLKVHDFRGTNGGGASPRPDAGRSLLAGDDGHGEGAMATHSHGNNPLALMLDSAVDEIFMPYMEGAKYLERESKSLTELYAADLSRFTSWHRSTAATKAKTTNIFDRVRAAAGGSNHPGSGSNTPTASGMATTTSGTSNSGASTPVGGQPAAAPVSKTSAFSKLSGFVDRARGAASTPVNAEDGAVDAHGPASAVVGDSSLPTADGLSTEETEGDLSLNVAERMLRWHAEAIGRCVDLSNPSDSGKNAFALLRVLADAFLKSYLEVALDSGLSILAAQDVRSASMPDMSSMRMVRQVELITALWQHYISVALIPLTSGSVTLRREMAIFNYHNLLRVEGKSDAFVQRVVDNLIAYLVNRLATQKKNDFAPKNEELAFSRMNTDPCIACSEALERAARVVRSSLLSPANVESVLLEIGVSFHSLLLDHFKKYTISATGGLMLTKDLAMYQDAIATFQMPLLNDRFEMLRSLGNLFIVQPGALKGYMREGALGKIEERFLQTFLARRGDYSKELKEISGSTADTGSTDEGMTSRNRAHSSSDSGVGGKAGSGAGANVAAGLRGAPGAAGGGGRLSVMLDDLERFAAGSPGPNASKPAA
ncbi:unnamed protein product [Jaminaea pallidilutea]